MRITALWQMGFHVTMVGLCFTAHGAAQVKSEQPSNEKKSKARLEFMRDAVQKIEIVSTVKNDKRDLKIKEQPLLRYNDPARGVTDSAVWRLGGTGRPALIVTSEIYGTKMSHEFLAIDNPQLTVRSDLFYWQAPEKTLNLQEIKSDERAGEKPALRLTQMKRLTERFALRQLHQGENIELRILPTPIDRYVPSDKRSADGAIFAAVWGVNPEVLLFIETDGSSWSYAFMRSSGARLWALLDNVEVWSAPESWKTPSKDYSVTTNSKIVPAEVLPNDENKQSQ